MVTRIVMKNGLIPAGTVCVWRNVCGKFKNAECTHAGPHKDIDYTCDYAKAHELINEVAGVPQPEEVKQRKKFEYCVTSLLKGVTQEDILKFLNEKGKLGWELCETDYGFFIFKREVV